MNDADVSGSFSPEDWALIRSSPLLAGLLITLSDLRTGPIGVLKEGFAPSQAIIEAGEGAANPIVASIVANIKEMAKKGERLQPPFQVSGKNPEQLKTEVAALLKRIPGILDAKVSPEQAAGFKSWLMTIADKVANAARERVFWFRWREGQRGGVRRDQGLGFRLGCAGIELLFRKSHPAERKFLSGSDRTAF
jgi:hypothetical protein